MALVKRSSPPATTSTPAKVTNYRDLLRRAHDQKILARAMVIKAKQMVDSAVQMRNRPSVVFLLDALFRVRGPSRRLP